MIEYVKMAADDTFYDFFNDYNYMFTALAVVTFVIVAAAVLVDVLHIPNARFAKDRKCPAACEGRLPIMVVSVYSWANNCMLHG